MFKKSLLLFFMAGIALESMAQQKQFFVSPKGSDHNWGSAEAPFASIQKAKDAVLESRKKAPDLSYSIELGEGTYHLTEPLVFRPEESGSDQQPYVIQAAAGGHVTLSGAKVLKMSWKTYRGKVLVSKVPKGISFLTLSFGGKAQILARYPNCQAGVYPYGGYAEDALSPARIQSWKNPKGGYIHALHKGRWGGMHYEISGKNADGTLSYRGGWQNNRASEMHPTMRFVENVFEELDSPGEWFLDREKSLLYYYPAEGLTPEELAVAEVGTLENLISLVGSEEKPVRNIHFKGIHFTQTAPTFMKTEERLMRSDWAVYRGGAILLDGTEGIRVESSEFSDLGGNAIFVSNYNRGARFQGNHIHDIGGGAINFVGSPNAVRSPSYNYHEFVSEQDMDTTPGPKTPEYPAKSEVFDNLIHDIGLIEKQVAGVQIQMAMDLLISHNTIYRVPRAGINIGDGAWGGHIIEFNDVFATVLETSDHGAFNSWGRDRFWHPDRKVMDDLAARHPEWIRLDAIKTTIIRNNRFQCDHGWDIDLDDGSSNYEIYNNLCLSGGLKLREGFYRTVYNNITLNNGFHPHVWFKDSHDVFTRNIVMVPHKQIQVNFWGDKVDQNFFVSTEDLDKSRAYGVELSGMAGDPLFVEAENGDFTVKDISPAKSLGFENFPMDRFGVNSPNLKMLAEIAPIPSLQMSVIGKVEDTTLWRGYKLKTVNSLGEQSAAGLHEMKGVLILEVSENNPSGQSSLQKGDVILACWDERVDQVIGLLKAEKGNVWKGKMVLTVWRNQGEIQVDTAN